MLPFRPIVVVVLLTGGAALVHELAWARWMLLCLGSTTEGVALVTAATMLGFALGAWVSRRADRSPRLRLYGLLELGVGVAGLGCALALRASVTADWSAAVPRPLAMAVVTAMVVVPAGFMGATLPALAAWLSRAFDDAPRRLAVLYAANTLGAVGGVLLAGFALVPAVGYLASVVVASLLNVACGAAAIALDRAAARPSPPARAEADRSPPPPPTGARRAARRPSTPWWSRPRRGRPRWPTRCCPRASWCRGCSPRATRWR